MHVLKMEGMSLRGKRVLIREDLNVPVKDGKITGEARLEASLPTITMAMEGGARVMLMSHLGRPTEGDYSEADSLAPVAKRLGEMLGRDVPLIRDYLGGGLSLADGQVVLFENVRFNKGGAYDNEDLGKK